MLSQGTSLSVARGCDELRRAGACSTQDSWRPSSSQVPFPVLHLNPAGQQCTWSSQHTAWTKGQQPQAPDWRRQQV